MHLARTVHVFVCHALIASGALAQDPAVGWRRLASRTDSLYVEGRFHHYRVPVDQDPADERNWIFNPKNCMIVEFRLWIRRPDFRIWIHDLPGEEMNEDIQEFTWIDGTLTAMGDVTSVTQEQEWVVTLLPDLNRGRFQIEPFLTPFHFHLFDWRQGCGPGDWLKRPYRIEGNEITIELKSPDEGFWSVGVEVDPRRQYCPTRLTSLIGKDPLKRIIWDMWTLETKDIDGIPIITRARFTLYTPTINPTQRVLYLYEATRVEKRPISRADLEIDLPAGVIVQDIRNKNQWKTWVVGDPSSQQDMDMEMVRETVEAMRAQMFTPQIRAARKSAMIWIVVLGVSVSAIIFGMGLYIRRLRRA